MFLSFTKEKKSLFRIRGNNLYVFNLTYNITNERDPKTAKKNINRIYNSGMACSMFNYRLSLTTGKNDKPKDESMTILVPTEFGSWFGLICNNRILVPDTNALMNRLFSSLSFVLGKEYLKNLMN